LPTVGNFVAVDFSQVFGKLLAKSRYWDLDDAILSLEEIHTSFLTESCLFIWKKKDMSRVQIGVASGIGLLPPAIADVSPSPAACH
jgi:hypothetical protein